MRPTWVMGNWKMNGRTGLIIELVGELSNNLPPELKESCVLFPSSPYLPLVHNLIKDSGMLLGAQNVFPADQGAYTGEVSAPMLRDFNTQYVLIGHSERRRLFHEDEKFVAEKFHHVKDHDMIPVLCVGETAEERKNGLTRDVLRKQVLAVVNQDSRPFRHSIIAYEPVWAIGTGETATPEQAQEAHAFIRALAAENCEEDAERLCIIYGGSVNEKNAASLFEMPDIDGSLVGGASLNAQQFVEIVKCIS